MQRIVSVRARMFAVVVSSVMTTACSGSKSGEQPGEQIAQAGPSVSGHAAGKAGKAAGNDEPIDSKNLVKLELLADVERVAPGAEFELGAHFVMAPDWHIYWKNPGEGGLETRARFHAGDGIVLGEVRYPGPIRFESPGNVTSYGYEHDAVLFVRARAPAELDVEAVELTVDARWVACRDVCIAGKGSASLRLPVAGDAAPEAPKTPETPETPATAGQALAVFAAQRERLPRPFAELDGATAAWAPDSAAGDQGRTLVVRVPGADAVEFFPALEQPAHIADQRASLSGDQAQVEIHYRGTGNPAIVAGGVVRVVRSGMARYYEFAVPWS